MQSFHRFLVGIGMVLSVSGAAQELNCTVSINSERIQIQDKRIFDDMEQQFEQFLNNRKWTEDDFEAQERIRCNLLITIDAMPSIGNFNASVQVQSARPVYNADYETLVLNFADRDWAYNYTESQPLEFNPNTFTNNITSMLAFYAYVIIGLDYDTFGDKGGTRHLQLARDIVTNAQNSGAPGWSPFNSNRNRYWLIESILNQQFESLREGYYLYHREGLDIFHESPEDSRENMVQAVQALQESHKIDPNNIYVTTFLDSKAEELIKVFSQGDLNLRKQAFNILTEVDPSRQEDYQSILE